MTLLILIVVIVIFLSKTMFSPSPEFRGDNGELQVARKLKKLPESLYIVFNDITIPSKYGTTQIDHVVISVYGVFVIETKNYTGWIFASEYAEKWKQVFKTENHYFRNPIKQNYGHILSLQNILHVNRSAFHSIIVFSNYARFKIIDVSTTVIYLNDLLDEIESHTEILFSMKQVQEMANLIQSTIIRNEDIKQIHIKNVKDKIINDKKNLSNGVCPRCKGKLVLREGKYGKFYGCSNYPRCRYTHKY